MPGMFFFLFLKIEQHGFFLNFILKGVCFYLNTDGDYKGSRGS